MLILFKYNAVRKIVMTSALSSATATATTAKAVVAKPDRDLWLERSTTIGPVLQVTGLLPDIANLIADYTTVNDETNYAITPRVWRQLFPCLTEATFFDAPFPENIDAILQARSQFELGNPVAAAASGLASAAAATPPTEQNDQARVVDREVLCYMPPMEVTIGSKSTKKWGNLRQSMSHIQTLATTYLNTGLSDSLDPQIPPNYFIPAQPGRWVLLTRNLVKGTAGLSLEQQDERLSNTGYEIPFPLEIVTCCLLQKGWMRTRLYEGSIWSRCLYPQAIFTGSDYLYGISYSVKSFFSDTIDILTFCSDTIEASPYIGVGAMKILPPAKKQQTTTVSEIAPQSAAVLSASTATAAALPNS
jgi:hypothetical protein